MHNSFRSASVWVVALGMTACSRPPPQIDGVNDPGVAPSPTTTPAVEPEPCSGPDRPGTVCIGGGWFLMSRWSTLRWEKYKELLTPEPVQRVRLPSYRMDEHEVTNGEYAALVAKGAEPIPDKSGWGWIEDPMDPANDQTCGWEHGKPLTDRLEDPVVCVLRREAQAYCESVGGRLPTVAEWMKAGRGLEPDARRFPWGEEPPLDLNYATHPQQNWYEGYAVLGTHQTHSEGPWTGPVYSDRLGKSPWGVLGLAGNASEHLNTCREDLSKFYPDSLELDATKEAFKAECSNTILLGGSSWFVNIVPQAASMAIFELGTPVPEYLNRIGHQPSVFDIWGNTDFKSAPPEPPGNDWRDWRVGFRCVYDAE